MKPASQAGVLAAVGLMMLWLGAGDTMLRLVLPSFRVPLLLTGMVLVVLAGATLVRSVRLAKRSAIVDSPLSSDASCDGRGNDADHSHGVPRIGFLLLVPVLLTVALPIRPLGPQAGTVGEAATKPKPRITRLVPPGADPRQGTTIVQPSTAVVTKAPLDATIDGLTSAPLFEPEPDILREPVTVTGYVSGHGADGFTLSRYSIWCCVADAKVVSLQVVTTDPVTDGEWVRITAIYERPPPGTTPLEATQSFTVIALGPVEHVEEPTDPYEH